MRTLLKFNILFIIVLMLSGCSSHPEPMGKPLPTLNFAHLTPYQVDGGGVMLSKEGQSPSTVDGLSESPDQLLWRYAQSRFDTRAAPTRLSFHIQTASYTKQKPSAGGLPDAIGFWTGGAKDVYRLDILTRLSPIDNNGRKSSPFTVALKRDLFLPHNLSLAEREFREFEFFEKALHDIDRAVTDIVTNQL